MRFPGSGTQEQLSNEANSITLNFSEFFSRFTSIDRVLYPFLMVSNVVISGTQVPREMLGLVR